MDNEEFDINKITESSEIGRYEKRISVLEHRGLYVENIKEVIDKSIKNLDESKNSFIIYGEPQSGKTELMIALTAKLLDKGYKTIIILVTDQITLLNQNLKRFKDSRLNPSPKNYTEIVDDSTEIGDKPLVIFCKKNSQNLKKLIERLGDKRSGSRSFYLDRDDTFFFLLVPDNLFYRLNGEHLKKTNPIYLILHILDSKKVKTNNGKHQKAKRKVQNNN